MLVSVLIPCYNSSKYLRRCLDSVCSQSYKNLQILVIDDGSTDETKDLVKKYKDKRIEYLWHKHQGIANTRNIALLKAKGDAIMFVDSDDWIEIDTIEILLQHLQQDSLDFCACSAIRETNNKSSNLLVTRQRYHVKNRDEVIFDFLSAKHLQGVVWNKLIRKKSINGLWFENGWNFSEDAMFVWHLLMRISKCGYLNEKLYHYYNTTNGVTNTFYKQFSDCHLSYLETWTKIYSDVSRNHPNLVTLANIKLVSAMSSTLYHIAKSEGNIKFRIDLINGIRVDIKHKFKYLCYPQFFRVRNILFSYIAISNWNLAVKMAYVWYKIKSLVR